MLAYLKNKEASFTLTPTPYPTLFRPVLQHVAIKLFTMATSGAASERNFSTMAFIHSKLRNSLSVVSVEKLVYIKSILPAFYD
jgi:hAT family C-terminal dimerisation region